MAELTATAARTAKPRAKRYKLAAGRGMYLEVTPEGGKRWRFRYRLDGREKLLSLGTYPDVPLKRAREKRDELRRLLAEGIDPGEKRKAEKAAHAEATTNSFEGVALEWYAVKSKGWAPTHAAKVKGRLERFLLPYLGSRPVATIKAPELLRVLRRIEAEGSIETAHRVRQVAGQVLRYAVATGRADSDVTGALKDALPPRNTKHMAAPSDPAKVGALLRAIWGYDASPIVAAALKLHPYVFTRPGELRLAEWAEFDLDAGQWEIPAGHMKMKQAHIVPLATQAVAILRELHPLTGRDRFVFPSARGKGRPMSDAAMSAAMRRLGIEKRELVPHGWRAVARTLLDERLNFRPEYIERQLAHRVAGPLGDAYARAKYLAERRAMMQAWADYLDSLRTGANVIPLRGRRGA